VQGAVRLWNLAAADVSRASVLLQQHHARIDQIVVPDARRMVTKDAKGEVRLWNLAADDVASSPAALRHSNSRIDQLELAADGRRLVTGDTTGEVRLWDLAAANVAGSSVSLPGAPVGDLAVENFCPTIVAWRPRMTKATSDCGA